MKRILARHGLLQSGQADDVLLTAPDDRIAVGPRSASPADQVAGIVHPATRSSGTGPTNRTPPRLTPVRHQNIEAGNIVSPLELLDQPWPSWANQSPQTDNNHAARPAHWN